MKNLRTTLLNTLILFACGLGLSGILFGLIDLKQAWHPAVDVCQSPTAVADACIVLTLSVLSLAAGLVAANVTNTQELALKAEEEAVLQREAFARMEPREQALRVAIAQHAIRRQREAITVSPNAHYPALLPGEEWLEEVDYDTLAEHYNDQEYYSQAPVR